MCLSLICFGGWDVSLRVRFTVAKWLYCVGFTATAIAVWVLRDYGGEFLAREVSSFKLCKQSSDPTLVRSCAGKEVALRVSFANLIYFGAHLLGCLLLTRSEDPRVDLHAGLWVWQLVTWLGSLIGFMWLPNTALYGYAQFARYASGVFLILQLVLLVNFVYEINEWLVERDTRAAWAVLVGGTAVSFGGGLVGVVLTGITYHYYAPTGSCSLNLFFITWNLVVGLLLVGVLFVPGRAPTAGLLTSGAVWLYCSYLTYSALASEPANRCVRGGGVSAGGWVGVVAFFIALAAVIYTTLDAGIRDMFGGGKSAAGSGGDDDSQELPYRPDFFHLVFATASCYLAMLFTNWAVSQSTTAFEIDKGWASTWVKVASGWVCALLYGWTVIAPAVLKDRDFGFPV
ncbi:hypothetical protein VOLCADRAFT_77374 [Volvox carteri f. nagariensis]|uniref:Serine incorporator n=1 Tax=Volvox carteri f. nagariensis TaxID=3068 RepID=D8UEC7_VOLCA|nr:uncharacterized protein VOLCADRAFT_77374 [Volvox carteri f. nagariensis]EFJ41981.1 hypothetical protein VOLCADRAFT_77374 [Volvox carteri f. nagariensis]|eukprot:XP_002957018.1 hypothetical protein VOLCADRAFT_77374 [Volvox carteri f. nagariensis]